MFEPCTLTAEAVRLFRLLSARLRAVPEDEFDLSCWYHTLYEEDTGIPCGSTACAIGYACEMPEFNAVGLRRAGNFPLLTTAAGDKYGDWAAVRWVFGISYANTLTLFSDDNYPDGDKTTAAQVADRIDQFVALYGPKETADV